MNKEEKKQTTIRNNRKTKLIKKKILIYVMLIIAVIYIGYVVYLLVKKPTDIFIVEEGKVYLEESSIGYVIRDEQVVKGENYKNGMEQIKSEGERAAVQEPIFRYYSKNEETLKQKILDLDGKIQEAMSNDDRLSTSDMKLLENQIDKKLESINQITDVTKLTEYKKEINDLILKKAKIAGEQSPRGSYLAQLIAQRSEYENQLNSGTEYIKAPQSGIVSYKVDGLEEVLTPNNFGELSKEYLENLNLKTGKMVASSEECGKVINNFYCYIATVSNSEKAKEAKVGDNVKVRLASNTEVPAEITNISIENDGDILIILKIEKQIEELINYRKISFDLIWWSFSGLKIPNQAIVEENGLHYVVRNRAGYLSKLLVDVKKQNEKYSIVAPYSSDKLKELGFTDKQINNYKKISLYDEIILEPDLSKAD